MIQWIPIKKHILERAAILRPGKKFDRVSIEWKAYLIGRVQEIIDSAVRSHPSIGKTVYPPIRPSKKRKDDED